MNRFYHSVIFFAFLQLVVSVVDGQQSEDTKTDEKIVGVVNESLLPTGRLIKPAGQTFSFHGRPVDLRLSDDGKLLFVKDRKALRVIDADTLKLLQTIESPDGASLLGLAVSKTGTVYFTNSKQGLHVFAPQSEESGNQQSQIYALAHTIELPRDSFPCGIALSADQLTAYVCLSKLNSVAIVNLAEKKITAQIPVGIAPLDLRLASPNQMVVSNMGGRRANPDDQIALSAGTPTVVDRRGIASSGTLSIIHLDDPPNVVNEIPVGRHPSLMNGQGNQTYVCNTNDDSISLVDLQQELGRWNIKPDPNLPFGSMPSALLQCRDSMLVALAGNNAIAVLKTRGKQQPRIQGLIPTGWYPAAMAHNDRYLFVANIKGVGGRAKIRDASKGMNSHDHLGTIQRIPLENIFNEKKLADWTEQVNSNSRIPQILRANVAADKNPAAIPVPVPETLGHPSVLQHVIYVIKENRTFDQVFGDIKEARGEPKLCVFPELNTPNHHALARRFGILDNYYCNGVLSADGHSWATEGNVTPYLERAFGGFARSYTFGDDPITYSSSGFLWDRILDAGLSFRNYGEMDYAEPPAGMKYQEIWKAYAEGKQIEFQQKIGIERLRKYSCRDYPGWNMLIPDVLRMDRFLKEFREFEENNSLPHLCIVYLPQDHLGGGITSRSHMADNDLAIGRLVQAVSNSKFWKKTAIFINEDDPQNGFDHIDGHRSICLVISPYSRPGVNHTFFNQTAVLRTILHIFGLPPMNQQDASAGLMKNCFVDQGDFRPYQAIKANFPLNEAPQPQQKQSSIERKWRAILATVPIQRTGMKTEQDEDNLNRFIWHENKGWETPYPSDWAGPHGRGLAELGLAMDPNSADQ